MHAKIAELKTIFTAEEECLKTQASERARKWEKAYHIIKSKLMVAATEANVH